MPSSWREWDSRKLNEVILHEYAHIDRGDFSVQLLASLHAAVFWFSPMAWLLQSQLAALAEQASDDRVIRMTGDRVYYAEVLPGCLGQPRVSFEAVAMARASGAAKRIDLILDEGRKLSGSVPMGASAFIGLAGMPLLYLASSISLAQASSAPQAPVAPRVTRPVPPPARPSPPIPTPSSGSRLTFIMDIEDDSIRFRQDANWYVIKDKATIAQAQSFQRTLRQFDERKRVIGQEQRALSEEQRKTGEKMRASQNDLGKLQSLGMLQAELGMLQYEASNGQSEIGKEMAKIGDAKPN